MKRLTKWVLLLSSLLLFSGCKLTFDVKFDKKKAMEIIDYLPTGETSESEGVK